MNRNRKPPMGPLSFFSFRKKKLECNLRQRRLQIKCFLFLACLAAWGRSSLAFANAPVFTRLTLTDPTVESWQPSGASEHYANQRSLKAQLEFSGNASTFRWREEGEPWSSPVPITGTVAAIIIPEGDRNVILSAYLESPQGEPSEVLRDGVLLDTLPPDSSRAHLEAFPNGPAVPIADVNISWAGFNDSGTLPSGIQGYRVEVPALGLTAWASEARYALRGLDQGTYGVFVAAGDKAGNTGPPLFTEFCVDTQPPASSLVRISFNSGGSCTNAPDLRVTWQGFVDNAPCNQVPGIAAYALRYFVNGELLPVDLDFRPAVVPGATVLWRNAPEGRCKVEVSALDSAYNRSPPAFGSIVVERVAPHIPLAGFWDSAVTSAEGGTVSFLAWVPDNDVPVVEMYFWPAGGTPVAFQLDAVDNGTSGDALAGDHFYSFQIPLSPGAPTGRYPIAAWAEDPCGNAAVPWPLLAIDQ